MTGYLIADRYAGALSAALTEDSQLETALASLQEISSLFDAHHELHSCLSNPAIEVHLREKVLDEVLQRLGAQQAVVRLVHELMERGRMPVLRETVMRFEEIVDARLNRVAARVTTAGPLRPEQQQQLQGKLSAYAGKSVRLKCTVDPEVIGGVVARIGWKVIDDSVRTRLTKLKDALIAEEVEPHENSGD